MMKILFFFFFLFMMGAYNFLVMFFMNMYFLVAALMLLMYSQKIGDNWISVGGYLGVDGYSFFLILLSVWIVGLMFLSLLSEEEGSFIKGSEGNLKLMMFNIVMLVLLLFFCSCNLLMLYLFFEFSLIPTFFIVLLWGKNMERLEASMYLIMYMMFISLPLLVYILKVYKENYSLDLNLGMLTELNNLTAILGLWDFVIIFGAFFIKLPIFLFHMWLPKAHVEAPVYGSMLLAAVLLKLGGYGLLRLIMMFISVSLRYSYLVSSVGILGALFSSVLCLTQVDLKSLVAYSSVVHMNFMLVSLFTLLKLGFISSFVVMVSHGLCSSGLFYFVTLCYKYSLSRLLILNKGYINIMPSLMIWWFMLCSSNFSFPFSLNFVGEIMLIMSILSWEMSLAYMISMVCFLSGAYSLYMFSVILHGGQFSWEMGDLGGLIDILSLMLHCLPLLILLVNLFMFVL